MERFLQNENKLNMEQLKEFARHIANMYVQAAKQHLKEGDPLRNRIIDYYSVRQETEQELLNILEKKNVQEISAYMQNVKDFTDNLSKFIEQMEKLYELQDVHKRRKELASQDRLATDEEYKLGAYADILESQVRNAVFAAQKKGYLTFQSGFREKSDRDQFMDFYNRNIFIPEEALRYMKEQSIEVKLENLDDRTTLTLNPIGTDTIRLVQWNEIWNRLINKLPLAESETVPNMKLTGEHVAFQRKQDSLRKRR